MTPESRIYVAGHTGLVGSAIARELTRGGYAKVITRRHAELDLTDRGAVRDFFETMRPEYVFLAAAKVGGILANDNFPADFLLDNLLIETNILKAAHETGVKKVLFLGSSCIYPKFAAQPIREDALLTGVLEPTNEPYAIAKIAGLKLAAAYRRQHGSDFISAMPTNLYGPGDNFDLETSHVIPALIRKAHDAEVRGADTFTIWGTGNVRREFLHVDDCADALVFLMQAYSGEEHVNVGSGEDLTILALAELVAETVGFKGRIVTDTTKPDGTPRKLLSNDRLRTLGWQPKTPLRQGLAETYRWFVESWK